MAPQLRHLPHRRRYRSQHLSLDSSTSRTTKRALRDATNESADRLSDLPDSVVCHILSFLDTKYAVATSILSKRWKHLYISVPNIILDDSLTRNTKNEESFTVFAMFGLKQIMLRTVPHINLFRLKCNFIFKYHLIRTLLSAAIFRNVKELDICVSVANAGNLSLPPEVFTSSTLVVLKLKGVLELLGDDGSSSGDDEPVPSPVLVVPDLVSLPRLKVLRLSNFVLETSVDRLFWGCKLLEDLCLSRCIYDYRGDILVFSFPSLRKFSVKNGHTPDGLCHIGLSIDAPNLQLFEYHAEIAKFLWMREPMSNGIAKFGFRETKFQDLLQFIIELCGYKSLYLREQPELPLQVKPKDFSEDDCPVEAPTRFKAPPAFETLSRLEFRASSLNILPDILDCAPKLEVLVIDKETVYAETDLWDFQRRETVPICLTECLRNIEFRSQITFKFVFELDVEVMKYFLQNGKVLERMKISIEFLFYKFYEEGSTYSSVRKAIDEKFEMLQGCSKTCEVVVNW